ncbi:M4 family metallopeptidase [Luteimonas sp. 50]|uniref:Neutral metalloproteinase n=1 Tax=Cognatiluteimonas sedimenti TaxID=2927791 RepID=A0ABT0A2M8_9GAMM|nr:M4 family metallopeptidase [Lysobacter sedimenti]MCJ0825200.1 M4 family metallopeptidase [Lysobacter sedimenti]
MQNRLLSVAIVAALAVPASALAAQPINSQAAGRALGLIDAHAAVLHRADADGFVARTVVVGKDGTEHARFDRTFRGLPVIGGDVVVHSRNGQFKGASQTLKTSMRPGVTGRLGKAQAITEAGAAFGLGFEGTPSARKVIYARGASPVLAWEVTMRGIRADQTPTEMHFFVDAGNGRVLDRYDAIHTANRVTRKGKPGGGGTTCNTSASGTGKSLFSGNVGINTAKCSDGTYQMKDLTRGGGYTTDLKNRTSGSGTTFADADNSWGSNTTADRATVGADAHYGVAETWDYYKNVHGRNGIANDGKGALSRVHYGRNYVNAFWSDSCFCMTFGDGGGSYYPLVNIDVAGHEMSHGVTSRSANLTYSGESGGLNESTSDIFGTMVEYYSNNANDTPDYMIGEEIYVNNPSGTAALRYMFKPSLDGASPDCYSPNVGSMDVHYSSGIGNHFFYLLAEGATTPAGFNVTPAQLVCNGNTSAGGIGRAAAEKIWYLALTGYMTSNTNYAGARTATLNAARDLYGTGSAQYNGVASAWSAVGVN